MEFQTQKQKSFALFVHGHTFLKQEEEYYTTGSLNQEVMNRYISWYDSLRVFGTTRSIGESDSVFLQEKNKLEGISFELVIVHRNLLTLFENARKIKSEVRNSTMVIGRMSLYGAIALHYAKKFGVKHIAEVVSCPWDSRHKKNPKGLLIALIYRIIYRVIIKNADNVLYVTSSFLQRRYPTKNNAISCSDVDLKQQDITILQKRLSTIQKRESEAFKLCSVGACNYYKGHDIAIKGLAKLRSEVICCHYYIVGSGEGEKLKELVQKYKLEKYVHFLGYLPHGDIFSLLESMDIYLQPSRQEGLPRALLEAMSVGCPAIGSKVGGIPELLSDEYLFKKNSVNGLMRAVKKIMTKENLEAAAKKNFEKSKEYERCLLDEKRTSFYASILK